MSPRPRSANPHTPRSISLPKSMWLEIDERLGAMGSTSAWIAKAVKEKLEKTPELGTVRSKSLMIELLRTDRELPSHLRAMLEGALKDMELD